MLLNVHVKEMRFEKTKEISLKSMYEKKKATDLDFFVDPTFMCSFVVQGSVRGLVYMHPFIYCMTATGRCQFATDIWSRCC